MLLLQTDSEWIPLGYSYVSHCSSNAIDHIALAIVFAHDFSPFLHICSFSTQPNDYCFWCNGTISNYWHVHDCLPGGECAVWSYRPLRRQSLDISVTLPVCLSLHVITLMQFHVFLFSCLLVIYPFLAFFFLPLSCCAPYRSALPDIDKDISTVWAQRRCSNRGHAMSFSFFAVWINLSNALPVLSCIIYLVVPCRYLPESECVWFLRYITLSPSIEYYYFFLTFLGKFQEVFCVYTD